MAPGRICTGTRGSQWLVTFLPPKNFEIGRSKAWEKMVVKCFMKCFQKRQASGGLCPGGSLLLSRVLPAGGSSPGVPTPPGTEEKPPPPGTVLNITQKLVQKKRKHLSVCQNDKPKPAEDKRNKQTNRPVSLGT